MRRGLIQIKFVSRQHNRMPNMSRHPLVPEIIFALTVKLAVIVAAALFVFSPGQRPRIDAALMQERLTGTVPASPQTRIFSP